ncbi:MAG: hypothetical protein ACHQ8D_03700 [Candidatus Rokuibacteriota bacterium]
MDDLVNQKDSSGKFVKRAEFLAALRGATTTTAYLKLLENQAGVQRAETEYLERKFYTKPNAWGADGKAVYAILHAGLVTALEEAGDTLFLDSYWLAGGAGKTTESIIVKSAVQVTRIFLTPPIPLPKSESKTKTKTKTKTKSRIDPSMIRHTPAPMWVIAARASASEKKGFKTFDAEVKVVRGNVVTWERREFP